MPAPFGLVLITGNLTHQENYARSLAADPRCRLVGLADEAEIPDRRRQLNQDLADELSIPYLQDLHEAIGRDDVDCISICAEPERRVDMTISCAAAGKHLYLDKDPAPTVEGAWRIVDAIREHGVISQAFSLVQLPAAQRAKQIYESGELGDLIAVHCDLTFAKGIAGTADLSQPRIEKAEASRFSFIDSKRELLCTGYYALAFFQWLTGRGFVSVDATSSNYFFVEHQQNDVEDFACLLLGMDGGLEATLTCGRTGWMSHPSHGTHDIRLIGTKGSISLDAYAPRLEIFSDGTPWTQPKQGHPEDPMGFWSSTQAAGGVTPKTSWHPVVAASRNDAIAFLDCLEQGRASDVPAEIAAHCVDAIHAAWQSAATGETVRIRRGREQEQAS